jgi:DNA-binding MarR family transcriptional regulator
VTGLDAFFSEVVALAHQLRKTDFRAQQGNGLLAAGRKVLQVLEDAGPRTVPAIAARQNSSRQNVQIIANRFAREGLVEFVPNAAHKKSKLLRITQQGQKALAASSGFENQALKELALELKDSELQTALEMLRRVRQELSLRQSPPRDGKRKATPKSAEGSSSPKKEGPGSVAQTEEDESSLPVNLL